MPPIRLNNLEKPKSTRTAISVKIKKEICEYIVANPNVNQGEVAVFFNRSKLIGFFKLNILYIILKIYI